jgi:hypothetical protein
MPNCTLYTPMETLLNCFTANEQLSDVTRLLGDGLLGTEVRTLLQRKGAGTMALLAHTTFHWSARQDGA